VRPLDDPDGLISYTSLAELERCGYRYYLERHLRLPERRVAAPDSARAELDPRVRGTIVHALLEAVDFARPRAPGQDDVALLARRLGTALTADQRREIVALLERALATEPAARLARARLVRREHPFAFALARPGSSDRREPLVTGFIDLIAAEPDGTTVIVDYKTDRLSGEEDLERLVRRDYGFQRLIYALAAIEDGARQVEGGARQVEGGDRQVEGKRPQIEVAHWFLERPQGWVSARYCLADGERLRERLLAEIDSARARGFAVAAEPHRELCLTCPGRGGLCSWGESHTMRARSTTLAARR
jgi:ATP-dependent helicase/nuclease subunit A